MLRARPIVLGSKRARALLRHIESASAPYPPFDQVRVDLAGMLDWKIALAHGPMPFGAKAHFVFERSRFEKIENLIVDCIVECRRDAMTDQHREADVLERRPESIGKAGLIVH